MTMTRISSRSVMALRPPHCPVFIVMHVCRQYLKSPYHFSSDQLVISSSPPSFPSGPKEYRS
jgi:hypothetical protein